VAERVGSRALVDQAVDSAIVRARLTWGAKVIALISAIAVGTDSIDRLRRSAWAEPPRCSATGSPHPRRPGSFLHASTFGLVRELLPVARPVNRAGHDGGWASGLALVDSLSN
jgi:hypothetical protein